MSNVVNLNEHRPPMVYRIEVTHDSSGTVSTATHGIGTSLRDRHAALYALRLAIEGLEFAIEEMEQEANDIGKPCDT